MSLELRIQNLFQICGGDEPDEVQVEYIISFLRSLELDGSTPSAEAISETQDFLSSQLDSLDSNPEKERLVLDLLIDASFQSSSASSSQNQSETVKPSIEQLERSVQILLDIFPNCDVALIKKTLKKFQDDVYDAAGELSVILSQMEKQSASASASTSSDHQQPKLSTKQQEEISQIKAFIQERFSVNNDKENITHRPTVKWEQDPKKKIRYLNNQVVSTRGEKFTFVKTEADAEMEKKMENTYVRLGTLITKGKRGA